MWVPSLRDGEIKVLLNIKISVQAPKVHEFKSHGITAVTEVYDTQNQVCTYLWWENVTVFVISEYRQIAAFYKIVRVYRHIYFTATFISYPHPSLNVNKRVEKATLIMSDQEIFNVKYREYGRGGSLRGGKVILKVMYGGKKYCFCFYAVFFLLSLKKNDITWVALDISQQTCCKH